MLVVFYYDQLQGRCRKISVWKFEDSRHANDSQAGISVCRLTQLQHHQLKTVKLTWREQSPRRFALQKSPPDFPMKLRLLKLSNRNLAWRHSTSTYCRITERTEGSHSALAVPIHRELLSSEAPFGMNLCLVPSRLFCLLCRYFYSLCCRHRSGWVGISAPHTLDVNN